MRILKQPSFKVSSQLFFRYFLCLNLCGFTFDNFNQLVSASITEIIVMSCASLSKHDTWHSFQLSRARMCGQRRFCASITASRDATRASSVVLSATQTCVGSWDSSLRVRVASHQVVPLLPTQTSQKLTSRQKHKTPQPPEQWHSTLVMNNKLNSTDDKSLTEFLDHCHHVLSPDAYLSL